VFDLKASFAYGIFSSNIYFFNLFVIPEINNYHNYLQIPYVICVCDEYQVINFPRHPETITCPA